MLFRSSSICFPVTIHRYSGAVTRPLDPSLGPVATVLINAGTLKFMDNFVVGEAYGRVKVMKNPQGKIVGVRAEQVDDALTQGYQKV